MQIRYVEYCNGNIRRELLNTYLFQTLDEVRQQAEILRLDYNENRPHESLGYVPPAEYKAKYRAYKTEKSNAKKLTYHCSRKQGSLQIFNTYCSTH
jgi:hypothetical protein